MALVKRRTLKRLVIAFLLVAAGGIFALLVARPKGADHVLPIVFLGYTTDEQGTKRAIFSVTNVHDRSIQFRTWTEIKSTAGWPDTLGGGVSWVLPQTEYIPVAPRTNSFFAITVHTNDITWRVVFLYEKATTRRDELIWPLKRMFYSVGLDAVARKIPCEKFYSHINYGPEIQE